MEHPPIVAPSDGRLGQFAMDVPGGVGGPNEVTVSDAATRASYRCADETWARRVVDDEVTP